MSRQDATLWGSVRFPNEEAFQQGAKAINAFLVSNGADAIDFATQTDEFELVEDGAMRQLGMNVHICVHDYDQSDVHALEKAMATLVAEPTYLVIDNYDTGDIDSRRTAVFLGDRKAAKICFALSELENVIQLNASQRSRIADVLRDGSGGGKRNAASIARKAKP